VTDLVLAIFRAHQALVGEGDRQVAGLGLTSARWKVLGAIALAGEPLSAAEIGRRMGLSRQAAQKQLDGLLADELVDRRDDVSDRRATLHELTRAGEVAFTKADEVWTSWSKELGRGVPKKTWDDAASLVDLLAARASSGNISEES
jgi:DNA-binding MarR family transcriptional regulator